ncbi:DUF6090 family protein [Lutimonas zeaxanthinifaciens]|uniref:DUF6090 family protein n=1 Tax=Lutimonas zeaxanthinifaciens TaxID=3060215 RepID=UPI00265CB7E3|nr:DUF6090 family protein [Lutimonas sp. YSD2104]WKK67526.1 DUF6090 family protein [Lutimonas sp. YSD2104]
MADDNRPLKYARYAIGEIILVVIGILIALQVNNWNLDRMARIDSRNIHSRLEEDLSNETIVLTERLEYYLMVQEHAKKTVQALTDHPDSLGSDFILNAYQASQSWMYRNVRDTYDEIISTGSIKLIPDPELRKRIGSYYDETDIYMQIWYKKGDYRELARKHIPYEVQKKIQSTCEIWTTVDQQYGRNAIVENCDLHLTEDEITKTIRLLHQNDLMRNQHFLLAANRQVADLELKIGLYRRKLKGNEELLKLMRISQP